MWCSNSSSTGANDNDGLKVVTIRNSVYIYKSGRNYITCDEMMRAWVPIAGRALAGHRPLDQLHHGKLSVRD